MTDPRRDPATGDHLSTEHSAGGSAAFREDHGWMDVDPEPEVRRPALRVGKARHPRARTVRGASRRRGDGS